MEYEAEAPDPKGRAEELDRGCGKGLSST